MLIYVKCLEWCLIHSKISITVQYCYYLYYYFCYYEIKHQLEGNSRPINAEKQTSTMTVTGKYLQSLCFLACMLHNFGGKNSLVLFGVATTHFEVTNTVSTITSSKVTHVSRWKKSLHQTYLRSKVHLLSEYNELLQIM